MVAFIKGTNMPKCVCNSRDSYPSAVHASTPPTSPGTPLHSFTISSSIPKFTNCPPTFPSSTPVPAAHALLSPASFMQN